MSVIFPGPPMTFEERLRAVRHRLLLIKTAAVADDVQMAEDPDALMEAVYMATQEALDLLAPLRAHMSDLPGGMCNWVAPEEEGGAR
jgi:hypothetical protein